MTTITLNGGTAIPQVGLGTWPMDDDQVRDALATALDLGYRHVDTAENYGNERGVGRAIREASVPREDIWVTTKFNKRWHTDVRAGVEGNLERLGLDYADLVLVHWPNPAQNRYVQAWEGLIALREEGLIRAIGTSNFLPEHLDRLIAETGVTPELNQIECHPYLDRANLRAYDDAHGIVTGSWSPLGRGNGLLDEPVVTTLADAHGATPSQIVLAWHLSQGLVVTPKSSDRTHLQQNLDAADITLTRDEIASLSALRGTAQPVDPNQFGH